MSTSPEGSVETWRGILRFALIGLILVSPLPFGSVTPLAVLVLQLYSAVLGGLALVVIRRGPDGLPRLARRLLMFAGVIWVVGLIQIIPAPRFWVAWLAEPTIRLRDQIGALVPDAVVSMSPLSLEPPATVDALLRYTAYCLIGLSAVVAVRTVIHLRQIALAIVASGAFQGLYGSAEYLSGHQHIFLYAKKYFLDSASGTFINRNHYAGYLGMTVPLALGLVLVGLQRSRSNIGWRARLVGLAEPAGLVRIVALLAAAVIWAGVLLSSSRSGLIVVIVVTCVVLFSATIGRRKTLVFASLLAIPTVWLLWQEVNTPLERFLAPTEQIASLSGRVPVWRALPAMVGRQPLLGTGFGTFEPGFDIYRPPDVTGGWDHAHNDWLQSAVEGGLVTVGCLIALGWLAVSRRSRVPSGESWLSLCSSAAILGIAVHSAVDFCLRIPALATLLAVLIGVVVATKCSLGSESTDAIRVLVVRDTET